MIAPARLAALDALRQIDADRLDMGEAVARVRKPLSDERDRALLLEIVSGTLRMRAALDHQLALRLTRPIGRLDAMVLDILRMSAFQLIYLTRTPSSAVINDAVDLTRRGGTSSATGLVNAVLRSLNRDRQKLRWPARPAEVAGAAAMAGYFSVVHSHPEWLVARWLARYGAADTERWLNFNNRGPALCLVPNRTLASREALEEELKSDGVDTQRTTRASHGLHVTDGQVLGTRAFREGRCLVQDEASQLISELVGAQRADRILDLCASPGGKTVAMAADLGPSGLIVATDVRRHRLRVLTDTLGRCRITGAHVVQVPATGDLPFAERSFDRILIDAPCSGLGTVRRDPDIRWRVAEADLPALAATQLALLQRTASLVRPGGTLVYSTCSSEPDENQQVVAAFLAGSADFALAREHQTLPFRDALEAFFGAVLVRRA
ncbi:MAG: 16S rRNA (cytosine(967)-C(5))-methyltransferase RsmB [Acidobacteria bacterium]|nr:16S rRNA (cytosine(967)-C(5))-methyltransferase RsmB [Acidobacteriota bacterium]